MELGKFATKQNAESGVWVEPIIFGEESGIEIRLLGSDSDVARKHASQTLREIQAMTRPQQERVDYVARGREEIVTRTAGIRVKGEEGPVTVNGEVIEDNPSGYRKLYEEIPELQKFAKEYTDNRSNFLSKQKETLKKP